MGLLAISREIRPLAALYSPPPYKKMCFTGLRSLTSLLISNLSGRQGLYSHAYGICAPFYQSKIYMCGGVGCITLPGLISRDIAGLPIVKCLLDVIIDHFIYYNCYYNIYEKCDTYNPSSSSLLVPYEGTSPNISAAAIAAAAARAASLLLLLLLLLLLFIIFMAAIYNNNNESQV